jgi:ceramide glucosyltransferase
MAPAEHPSVTIMKPICGHDPGLYDNLVSFCAQSYAGPVQIVIGAHRESDPAVAIARQVIADRPDADITLVIDGALPGTNFKICNLANMLPAVKHEILVISDSDMRVEPDYLDAVIGPLMRPGIGMATTLYKAVPVGGLPSRLGAAFINYSFLPSVLVGRMLNAASFCSGSTMALRRATLDQVGGFGALVNQLADDYVLGALVRQAGLDVVISRYVIENIVLEASAPALFRHELRWQRTVRAITPVGLAATVITNPLPLALLAIPLTGFATDAWLIAGASLAARLALVYIAHFKLGLPRMGFRLLPLRDALSLVVLAISFTGHRVSWRQSNFQIREGGELTFEGDPLA